MGHATVRRRSQITGGDAVRVSLALVRTNLVPLDVAAVGVEGADAVLAFRLVATQKTQGVGLAAADVAHAVLAGRVVATGLEAEW